MQEKPKIIVIVGPTASGKSDLAVLLAKKFNGEIVSADSRQVYRGMDIGTGKVPGKWRMADGKAVFVYKGVKHHLIDFANPNKQYSVLRFQKEGRRVLRKLFAVGHLPIICGGTGFYIRALVDGITIPEVPPNPTLRRKLEKKSAEELCALLERQDPERAATIDRKNKRRLIRALEIVAAMGKVPKLASQPIYNPLFIGVRKSPEELRRLIHGRLLKRMKSGMVAEVKRLHDKQKVSWKRLESFGLEYRYIARYLQNKLPDDEMIKQLELAIWHYAKRQLTWFKRNKRIHWIKTEKEAFRLTERFLR